MSNNLTENAFESSLFHTFEQSWYIEDFFSFFFIKRFVNKHILNQHGFLGMCVCVCISPPFKNITNQWKLYKCYIIFICSYKKYF
jgi:hypothetical protein